MASTLTNLVVHIIFSTKQRQPLISPEMTVDLYPYLGGILRSLGGIPLMIGGIADHVHLLVKLPPVLAVSGVLQQLKGSSSKWLNEREIRSGPAFGWQLGYGAFSVSESAVYSVKNYIEKQIEHHRKISFQEEYLLFLQKNRIPYDERYIWD